MKNKVLLLLILFAAFYSAEAGKVSLILIFQKKTKILAMQKTEVNNYENEPAYQEAEKTAR